MSHVPHTNRISSWLIDLLNIDSSRKWHSFNDSVEMLAYGSYAIIKTILVILIILRWCQKQESGETARRNSLCCNNKTSTEKCNTCFMQVTSKLALLLFSAPTVYVAHKKDSYQETEKDYDFPNASESDSIEHVTDGTSNEKGNFEIPDVFINNRKASRIDVAIQAMVTLTICLVIISAFWHHFWIKVDIKDTCRSEIGIQCYPRHHNNQHIDQKYQNCTEWFNNLTNVEFHCFQFRLNFEYTFVVIGGLISLFFGVSRCGLTFLIEVVTLIFKHKAKCICRYCFCSQLKAKCHYCFCNQQDCTDYYCFNKHRLFCREILAFILNVFDTLLCFAIAVGYIIHLHCMREAQQKCGQNYDTVFVLFDTFFDSFNRVILPLGVVSTSLLLPIEDYVANNIEDNNVNNSGSQNRQCHHVSIEMEPKNEIIPLMIEDDERNTYKTVSQL